MTSNWSKTLKGRILKALPLIWYVTWQGISKSHCRGHGCHRKSHFRSWWGQMTSNFSKTLNGRILKSFPFIWYVTWHGIGKSHCCGHGGNLRSHFRSWWDQMTSNWSKTLVILQSLPFIWYVIWHGIQKSHCCGHGGHTFGLGEVKWPPIGLKNLKVEYWSPYLSFDMSHNMGYEKVIVVVMEVIWGHIFGHGEV